MKDELLGQLSAPIHWSGDTRADMIAFLHGHGCPKTAEHCLNVGVKARELAQKFNVDPARAELAGWLHDISAPIPNARRVEAAREFGLEILQEEIQSPMLLHQKLSVVVARELFRVDDEGVLSAIGCHTTLKMGTLPLDRIVFLADKIAWDQPGTPPYLNNMLDALNRCHSHDAAVKVYIDYVWAHRNAQFVPHPWFVDVSRSMEQT
ncbi:MAG: bis(5'-nucleosyl)-tetraphosphatase (symmetrical) YqeK [Anaerolineae bacterium]|nr:bis(5'-nucleosyl)-tetraphosphatase (symmetrical) YqeK [Anaerolineae bacterium]